MRAHNKHSHAGICMSVICIHGHEHIRACCCLYLAKRAAMQVRRLDGHVDSADMHVLAHDLICRDNHFEAFYSGANANESELILTDNVIFGTHACVHITCQRHTRVPYPADSAKAALPFMSYRMHDDNVHVQADAD
jgi:hypothetical protein